MNRCAGLLQVCERLLPTRRAGVAGRHQSQRQGPPDGEVGIVVRDPDVLARFVRTIDAIADVRGRGERLKSVQEPRRDVKMSKVVVIQQKCLLTAEGRRTLSDVDEHVVNRAMSAANQLRLAASCSAMHSADHALDGPRLRVLDECGGDARRADEVIEHPGIECSSKQPPLVTERFRCQQRDAGEVGLLDAHGVMLP